MTEIERLEAALQLIGNLPMEFNSRARAIAQNSVTPPEGGWRDTFTLEQIGKLLRWDGRELRRAQENVMESGRKQICEEEANKQGKNLEGFFGNQQFKDIAPTSETVKSRGPVTVKEEPLFPVNPDSYLPPAIEMIPVESSNIEGFGHDSNETLRVWFKNGTKYDYIGIEESEFIDLANAPSPGKAYNALTRGKGVKGIKL